MIGVFDSGDGGLFALHEIRRRLPNADVIFYADRKNAPYGTKSKRELIRLTARGVRRLLVEGADNVLIACCTASTVHSYLPDSLRERSVPIIYPTAKEAALSTTNRRLGVIATSHTARSLAFTNSLRDFDEDYSVFEIAMQGLVSLVELGSRDGNFSSADRMWLYKELCPLREQKIDTLILGCTHFGHLEREISYLMPGVRIINSAKEGAKEIIVRMPKYGRGTTIYL